MYVGFCKDIDEIFFACEKGKSNLLNELVEGCFGLLKKIYSCWGGAPFQVDSQPNATDDPNLSASTNSTNSGVYTEPVYTYSKNQRYNHREESNSLCTFCRVHFKTIVIALFIVLILGIDFTNLEMFYRFNSYPSVESPTTIQNIGGYKNQPKLLAESA